MNSIDLTQVQNCTCLNLRKAARVVTQVHNEALKPTGLKNTQFSLLAAISTFAEVTISTLAQTLVMDRTTLTRNLKPLEKRGLLEIEPGEDRRVRLVRLTAQGEQLYAEALPLWQTGQAKIVEDLGQDTTQQLLNLLATVINPTR